MTSTNPSDIDNLRRIVESGKESDRIALAQDPNTPDEILVLLVRDRSFLVQDFARGELNRRSPTTATSATASRPPAGPGPRGGSRPTLAALDEAASGAIGSSSFLRTMSVIVGVLGLLGAAVVAIGGLQTSSPVFIGVGVGVAVQALWFLAFGLAVAARVKLAGVQAQSK